MKPIITLSIILIALGCSSGKEIEHSDTNHEKHVARGKFGCIPNAKILLLPTGEFFEFVSDGKYYIYFIGATMHRNGDPTVTYPAVNIHFGSDTSVVADWNNAIMGKDLSTLEIGIESKLINPFSGKDYFKEASIWINDEKIFTSIK